MSAYSENLEDRLRVPCAYDRGWEFLVLSGFKNRCLRKLLDHGMKSDVVEMPFLSRQLST